MKLLNESIRFFGTKNQQHGSKYLYYFQQITAFQNKCMPKLNFEYAQGGVLYILYSQMNTQIILSA